MNEKINLKINKFLEELNKPNKKKVAFCLKVIIWNIECYAYSTTNKDIG